MGNKESNQLPSQYFEHPRLREVKLIEQPNSEFYLMEYRVSVNNQRQVQQWLKDKKKIQNQQTLEVLFLPEKYTFQKAGMCGSAGVIKLIFQDYLFLLDNEIKNRRQIDRPFLETQMWYLVYNILRARKQYQKHNQKLGDIQPKNIVINQDGQIKIISSQSWPGQISNYEAIVQSRDSKVYLAPQQCDQKSIKKGEYPVGVSNLAAQIFSIGVTLLEASTLEDCSVIYTKYPEIKFDSEKLKKIQDLLRNKYSDNLIKFIYFMLELNPLFRPTAGQLYSILQPYEDSILDLNQFLIDIKASQLSYNNYLKVNPKNKQNQWSINRLFEQKQNSISQSLQPQYIQYPTPVYQNSVQYQYRPQNMVIQPTKIIHPQTFANQPSSQQLFR